MSLSDQPKSPAQKNVYRLPMSILYLPGGVLIGAFFIGAFVAGGLDGLSILIGAGAFGVTFAIVAAMLRFGIRLVTSPTGIAYHNAGFHVRTTWDNVREIGTVVQSGHKVEALLLASDALEVSRWFSIVLAVSPLNINEYSRVIPVGYFKPDWKSGRLHEDVCRYAPQAFEGYVSRDQS